MKVIIAEKPSVGREYAAALGAKEKRDGYIEGNGWVVTWSFGHLATLCYPEDYDPALGEWNLDLLPFLPGQYKYQVIKDDRKQFGTVKQIYNDPSTEAIYYAGDSGREGLYIQMLIRQLAGHNPSAGEFVVWLNSQTREEILRGIREAKDINEYSDLRDAGYVRAIEDFATGINFSRALSILYAGMLNNASGQSKYRPIACGRVMSCVLAMVVDREREIRSFKAVPFYKPHSTITVSSNEIVGEWRAAEGSHYFGSPLLYSEYGFKNEDDAAEMIRSLPGEILIDAVDETTEKKNAPLLFNLAELQSECTRRFHR